MTTEANGAVTDAEAKAAAEDNYIDKLATDIIGQLAPQLQAMGHASAVLLFALSSAAKVVEVTAQRQLERVKVEFPERAAEFEATWLTILEHRERHENRAAEQARAAPLPPPPGEEQKP